jgi:CxxC motif-containing protein (DUF1111 family)
MHNDVSCVACHLQGGVGGGGPAEKNVTLLSLSDDARPAKARVAPSVVHPGFATARTVVLHRFGTTTDYEPWRQSLLDIDVSDGLSPEKAEERRAAIARRQSAHGPVGRVRHGAHQLLVSQRNAPALFGAGLIDRIPKEEIQRLAAEQSERGGVSGRAAPAAAEGVGRFGWRGQIETLEQFVLSACANELGLQSPHHEQPDDPIDPWPNAGEDMSAEEREALISFVAELPTPRQVAPAGTDEAVAVYAGRDLLDAVGCADCHVADVGPAFGIYSDLLLHDMGPRLSDPSPAAPSSMLVPTGQVSYLGPTSVLVSVESNLKQEWRTPPLWGVRDSAPYLHDGRAATIAESIAMHGGEAAASTKRYARLTAEEQSQLLAFLNTLAAPE